MATTFPLAQGGPSGPTSFRLQHSSPLDTLVRKSSAKRGQAGRPPTTSSQQYPAHLLDDYVDPEVQKGEDPYEDYSQEVKIPSPQYLSERQPQSPISPLLHGRFARSSIATASLNGSYIDARTSVDSRSVYQGSEYPYFDAESVYSQNDSVIRDSWRSGISSETARPYDPELPTQTSNNSLSGQGPRSPTVPSQIMSGSMTTMPTVVVSSADADMAQSAQQSTAYNVQRTGRTPVVRPITSNFSRPMRSPQTQTGALTPQQVTAPPPLPPNSEEQKRRVLERNANRTPSRSPSRSTQNQQMKFSVRSKSPLNPYLNAVEAPTSSDSLPNPFPLSPAGTHQPVPKPLNQSNSPSLNYSPTRLGTPPSLSPGLQADPRSSQSQTTSTSGSNTRSHLAPVALPRLPPERSDSPASLYSAYSYYNFESAISSPSGSELSSPRTSHIQQPASQPQSSAVQSSSPSEKQHSSSPVFLESQTPHDFLSLGIQNHEANRLRESAVYFEKSAKEDGGCGVGMLMWGLTLRHGWGCEKNEKVGFKWLRKAAEHAVGDLESARKGQSVDTGPVQVSKYVPVVLFFSECCNLPIQNELVLAIYEVGQCFFHGWGVGKDQKMAVVGTPFHVFYV